MKPGETVEIAGLHAALRRAAPRARAELHRGARRLRHAAPGWFDLGHDPLVEAPLHGAADADTEAGIKTIGFSQLYISLGDETGVAGAVARMWWKPMVTLIWLGGVLMMVAGAFPFSTRRLRVGAPSRRTRQRRPMWSPRCVRERLLSAFLVGCALLLAAPPSPSCPARFCPVPAQGGPRPRPFGRAALHGLPEPVDRRLRRRSRP